MKTILTFYDNSEAAEHAARFAWLIAKKVHANVLLATTCKIKDKLAELVFCEAESENLSDNISISLDHLAIFNSDQDEFNPTLTEIDVSKKDDKQLIEMINQDHIWMFMKGIHNDLTKDTSDINLNSILNRVQCPLLLVPEDWPVKSIERIVYMADLRYCRIRIVRFLEELAAPFKADVLIAHLSAKGLPNMADDYALSVFSQEVSSHASYDRLLFNNIKEKNLQTAIDVVINGMHNDIMAVVNHRFHFEEIMGGYITDKLPFNITIPLFIFPY
jgi:hypothetical protein